MNEIRTQSHRRVRLLALAVLATSHLMIVLDATIVNVALSAIAEDIGFDAAGLQWVITAYILTFGGFLLLGGRLADRFGGRDMFVLGAGLFGVGAFAAAVAGSGPLLIGGRALQGFGGAVLLPSALSLLLVVFPEGPDRHRALGLWAGVAAVGSTLGLILGGVLTQALSWRWVFWVSVPVAAAAALAARLVLPARSSRQAPRFDLAGAVLATSGLVVLVYALVQTTTAGWASAQTLALMTLAAGLLAAFARLQRVRTDPLVPLALIRSRRVLGADLVGFLFGAAIYAVFYFLSIFMGGVLGYSPVRIGLAFLPMSAGIAAAASVAGRLLGRVTWRSAIATGTLLTAGGLASLVRITPSSGYPGTLLPALACVGVGMGIALVALTSAAVSGVPGHHSGVASGLFSAAQQVGGALGLALLTAVSTARTESLTSSGLPAAPSALAAGWSLGFAVAAGLMLFATAVGVATIGSAKPEPPAAAPTVPSLDNRKESACPTS